MELLGWETGSWDASLCCRHRESRIRLFGRKLAALPVKTINVALLSPFVQRAQKGSLKLPPPLASAALAPA